jgi:hypothetical protein
MLEWFDHVSVVIESLGHADQREGSAFDCKGLQRLDKAWQDLGQRAEVLRILQLIGEERYSFVTGCLYR